MKPILRSRIHVIFLLLAAIGVAFPLVWRQRQATPSARPPASVPASPPSYGQVPLSFEANHGQAKEPVQFLARGTNATLYLTPTEAALEVRQPRTQKAADSESASQTALVKMKLLGANPTSVLQ